MRIRIGSQLRAALLGTTLVGAAGCHSYHIDTTIENHTGAAIQLLEVDYPSASFGTDNIAPGADFHYRFQVRGDGPLTLAVKFQEVVHSI